jgi:ATP synthase protein I
VDLPNDALEAPSPEAGLEQLEEGIGGIPAEPDASMQEYYQLQKELFLSTLILTGIIFPSVWVAYSLNIALNYLIGACIGGVYLKLLAKGVEKLGRSKNKVGKNQLALFIGLIVIASQIDQLQIVPIFLGFLTYKAALIVYMFRVLLIPRVS